MAEQEEVHRAVLTEDNRRAVISRSPSATAVARWSRDSCEAGKLMELRNAKRLGGGMIWHGSGTPGRAKPDMSNALAERISPRPGRVS